MSEWTAHQLLEAFPWDSGPRYLLRDRDAIYGEEFCETAKGMGIREVLTAPRSPWQNAYAERLLGSIRWECLDHVLVFREERTISRWNEEAAGHAERNRWHREEIHGGNHPAVAGGVSLGSLPQILNL